MRQLLYTITVLLLIGFNASAQEIAEKSSDMKITGFTGKIEKNNLSLEWNIPAGVEDNYWEVQTSGDGINFATLGLVMGADPKSEKRSFHYKQEIKKINPGIKFYRVLHIEKGQWAIASKSIGLVK